MSEVTAEVQVKKEKRKNILARILGYGMQAMIVVGFYCWETNSLYLNFLTFMHFLYWISAIIMGFVAVFTALLPVIIEKMGSEIDANNPDKIESFKALSKVLLTAKVQQKSWWRKIHTWCLNPALLLFIGLVMGHWTLFVAYGASLLATVAMGRAAASAYDGVPNSWKGVDSDGDGVPDDEALLMDEVSKDPITRALDAAKAKKEAEANAKQEVISHLVDAVLEGEE